MFRRAGVVLQVLLLVALILVAGCGAPTAIPTEAVAPTAAPTCRVALVMAGPISDQTFCYSAYQGLMKLRDEYGCEVAYSESVARPDYEETARGYAEEGYNWIVTHGVQFGDAVVSVASDYPEVKFIAMAAIIEEPSANSNYTAITHENHEACYLAGIVAGRKTRTNVVGCITGFPGPSFYADCNALFEGARSVNPDVHGLYSSPNSFEDIAAGRESALTMISAGADVIYEHADQAGLGVIQACEEEGVYAIGSAVDRNPEAPDTVIASTIDNWGGMIVQAFLNMQSPDYDYSHGYFWGLEMPYNYLVLSPGFVPDEVGAEVDEVAEQIISGEFAVPYDTSEPQ